MNIHMLEGFKNYLQAMNLTDDYVCPLSLFLRYCDEQNIDCKNITYDNLTGYILYNQNRQFHGRNISTERLNTYLKSIRKFYQYLIDSGQISSEKLEIIKKFKFYSVERKLRPKITRKEFKEMIGEIVSSRKLYRSTRIRAIFYFLFFTGLRAMEVVSIRREDIDLENNSAIVRLPNKSNRERTVFFPPEATQALKEYFEIEEQVNNAFNLNYHTLLRICVQVSSYLSTTRRLTVHDWRHAFAHQLADRNVNVRVIQKLLGHKDINTTLIYYEPTDEEMGKLYHKNVDSDKE